MSYKSEPGRYKFVLKVDWCNRSCGMGGYRHLVGAPVLIDKESDRQKETFYGDFYWGFYGDDKWMDGLQVRSQGCDSDEPRNLYAWSIEYRDVYSIDAGRAELMAKCLKRIDSGMDKLYREWGQAQTFAEYMMRAAKVMKVEYLAVRSPNPEMSGHPWKVIEVDGSARYCLEHIVSDWVNAKDKLQSAVA